MILSLINTDLQLNTITLDNASNNSTLCKIVEAVHNQRGYAGFWDAGENQLPLVFYLISSFIVESAQSLQQVFRSCHQPCCSCVYGLHYKNSSCRKCERNLGIQSKLAWQPSYRRDTRSHCRSSDSYHQSTLTYMLLRLRQHLDTYIE